MEWIIIGAMALTATIVLKNIFDYKIKELKKIGEDKALDELAKAYPSNVEMCKEYLKKLGNEQVEVEERKEANC